MTWHPIETAPSNGDRFLSLGDDGWISIVYWEEDGDLFLGDSFKPPESKLIAWQPLPLVVIEPIMFTAAHIARTTTLTD